MAAFGSVVLDQQSVYIASKPSTTPLLMTDYRRLFRTRSKPTASCKRENIIATITHLEREMCYLTTHSIHFINGYMASDIWLRIILIVRKESRCRHIGYSYRLTARVLLYAPSHRQDNTYHGLCYTSRGALAGTRNSYNTPGTTFTF